MMFRLLLLGVLLCQVSLLSAAQDLSGQWRFQVGDDPAWKAAGLDDADWPRLQVPGTLTAQLPYEFRGMGWYRHRFNWQPPQAGQLQALLLGPIQEADQVYLNGRLIGSNGTIADKLFAAVAAYRLPRFYQIPQGLLQPGSNVLAIRLQAMGSAGGIVSGPVLLGDPAELEARRAWQERWAYISQTALAAIMFAAALLAVFIAHWSRLDKSEHRWFAGLMLLAGCVISIESLPFYQSGLKTPLLQGIAYVFSYLALILFSRYLHAVFAVPPGRFQRFYEAAVLLALAVLLIGREQAVVAITNLAWLLLVTVFSIWALRHAWLAAKRKEPGARIWGLNLLLVWLALVVFSALGLPQPQWGRPDELALMVFTFGLLLAYARRVQALGERFQSLSRRLVDSVETERKRISQDLHDGVGQTLAAVTAQLGLMERSGDISQLAAVREDVVQSVDDLRRFVHDLHPLMLRHGDLRESLQEVLLRVQATYRISVDLQMKPLTVGAEMQAQLVRMLQECLHNALQHGKASQVVVEVRRDGAQLCMSVTDNGCGFDPHQALGKPGLGLISLHERAALLGGKVYIRPHDGGGTQVRFCGPLSNEQGR